MLMKSGKEGINTETEIKYEDNNKGSRRVWKRAPFYVFACTHIKKQYGLVISVHPFIGS